ncbi:MAG TPA: DinB family protein [Bryobacteraceae bacterium]|nr:DinB family protein [Bryobacteraceae bacterium]
MTRYQFLIDTYETERLKVLSVWGMFRDEDVAVRPSSPDGRGRNAIEHMAHQCTSEYNWFRNMFQIDTGTPATLETRGAFLEAYARDSAARLAALRAKDDAWWETKVSFFDVPRSRAWIVVRRIAHTAHHRGQQTFLLRMLGRDVFSTYGPTADTGNRVIYR